jgi:hypothetical protein
MRALYALRLATALAKAGYAIVYRPSFVRLRSFSPTRSSSTTSAGGLAQSEQASRFGKRQSFAQRFPERTEDE